MIYYTADLHFHYAPMLPGRPFDTVEEMDEALIRGWNETVADGDTVYVVGDVGYNGGHVPLDALRRLRGRKHLIRGNHDTGFADAERLYECFETVTDFNEIDDGESHILLCHYPIIYRKRGYMIHGHLHHGRGEEYQMLRELPKVLNAGVDVNFYRPVTLEQLVENNRAYYAGELDDAIPPPPRAGQMGGCRRSRTSGPSRRARRSENFPRIELKIQRIKKPRRVRVRRREKFRCFCRKTQSFFVGLNQNLRLSRRF